MPPDVLAWRRLCQILRDHDWKLVGNDLIESPSQSVWLNREDVETVDARDLRMHWRENQAHHQRLLRDEEPLGKEADRLRRVDEEIAQLVHALDQLNAG